MSDTPATAPAFAEEIMLLAEKLGELNERLAKAEADLATQTAPLDATKAAQDATLAALSAALSGIKALNFHVLGNDLGAVSKRVESVENLQKAEATELATMIGRVRERLDEAVAATEKKLAALESGRVEFAQRRDADAQVIAEKADRAELQQAVASLSAELGKARTEFAAMPTSFNPRGEWDALQQYKRLDVVSLNGSSYVAVCDNCEKPTKLSKGWTVLARRGAAPGGSSTDILASNEQTVAGEERSMAVTPSGLKEAAVYLGEGFSTLAESFQYWDHRGDCLVYPEHTMEAYRASVSAGARVVEIDVQMLRDGGLGIMHDDTVDRTTSSSGNVADFTSAAWANLVVDAGSFLGGSWGNLKAPFFRDVLREFGNKVPILIEIKSIGDGCGAAVLAELERSRISKDMVLINSFSASELTQFISAGYFTCLNYSSYTGTPSPATLAATGYTWIALPKSASTSYMDSLRSAGLKVAVYTVNIFNEATSLQSHSDAIYSDDAIYLRKAAKLVADPFFAQTWYHGQQASNTSGDGGGRGAFTASDLWGYDMASANTWVGALQGWASPMNGVASESGSTLTSVVINFSVKFVSAFATDRFAWVAIMTNDKEFYADTSGPAMSGYCFTARKNGTLDIFRYTSGVEAAFSIGSQAGTTITDGTTATFRITVTSTTVKIERTDVATTLTVSDTTHRGAYLHAGVKGIHGQFKDFAITFP